ncbi:amidase [Oceanobacillus alkalisoli]|uniref:amidase n=1 Tax=Oceanobacillus alkalisoli TaxID=2925113 RepID=UPI001EE3CEE3|nr:amidase [Oceanobacillus alkalisoli]MCG5102474.1 amidase [Oceanobacillus alkalisoli]
MTTELAYKSLKELSELIKDLKLSPVELLENQIKRIEERNPSINAFVFTDFEGARENARQKEKDILDGKYRSALHGIPVAMKDLFDFKPGWPTTFGGIELFKDNIADHYCVFAERTETAGANLIGKTNSPVFGARGVTDNPLFGPTRNPFNIAKNSGGSSGGSGAAVADGLITLAEGTDAGGSIRIPAAWCGIYGFKASFGRVPFVSRPNAFKAANIFIHEGTMTRTVEDAAIALNLITGMDHRDPFSVSDKLDYLSALGRPLKGMKIAYSPNLDIYPVDPEVASVIDSAVQLFEQAGAIVEVVSLGLKRTHKELSDLWHRLVGLSNAELLEGLKDAGLDILKDHPDALPSEIVNWVEKVKRLGAMDVLKDQQMRTEVYDTIQHVFHDYDLLVTPTVASLPVDNNNNRNTVGPTSINGEEIDPLIGWCMTYFTNFSGHPSASIPAGLSSTQLPVGMQIIGNRFADLDVIKASAAFEKLKPWHDIYKIVENRTLEVQKV